MNLANKLTIIRVILIPIFVAILLIPTITYHNYIALGIFIIASLTDFFDGQIARRRNLVTNFGKFADPLADKLLVCSAMICMCTPLVGADGKTPFNVLIPAWMVIIIVAREIFISGFRIIAAEQGLVLAAGWSGKFKTAFSMFMIIFVLLDINHPVFIYITWALIWISLALTVISMIEYVAKNKEVLKQ